MEVEHSVEHDKAMTYAIGDLHGEVTLLLRLLDVLPFRAEDTLVFLGDYMDRGEDSIATILALRELRRTHPACVFLRGNHDDEWLNDWDGARFTGVPWIDGAQGVWDKCDGQIPFEVGFWLEETRIEYEDEYAYYTHAGALPGEPFGKTPEFYKLWGDVRFLKSDYNWGKPVVFGHWQMKEPLVEPNKIGVDTGAYKSGILTAVRLPDRQIFQVRR
ncbi:MAG TPA: metallophosphoesterase [Ktedonosporobacter sp.]|nr:metallophosphoesterase [Ktedonosporobacter sp.]